jgi:hypothetical protein
MAHFDKTTRRKLITQMSGEFLRAALTSENVDAGRIIDEERVSKHTAQGAVRLARDHIDALEQEFKETNSTAH